MSNSSSHLGQSNIQQQMDRPTTLIAACGNGVAGVIVFALLPLLVGTSVNSLGVTEIQAGAVVSYYYIAYAVVALLSMFWIRNINWKKACVAGLVAMLIGLYIPVVHLNYDMLLLGMAITGAGAAIVFPLSLTLVADMTNTERAYSIKLVPEQLIPAAMLIVLSGQLIGFGLQHLLIAFSLIPMIALLMIAWIPDHGVEKKIVDASTSSHKHSTLTGVMGLISLVIFFLGFSGIWAFCERIAVDSNLDEQLTGQLLALGLITSGLGPMLGAVIEERFGRLLPVVIATLVSCLSLLLLLGEVTAMDFGMVMAILPFTFYFALCYFFSTIADADSNGKIAGLMAFALAIGAASGASVFGYFRSITSMEVTLSAMALAMVAGTVLILTVNQRVAKPLKTQGVVNDFSHERHG